MNDRVKVAIAIEGVTLLEDRAQVVRSQAIDVEAGGNRLVVENVSPLLVDKTLSVRVTNGSGRVVDSRIKRRTVVRRRDDRDQEQFGAQLLDLETERDQLVREVRKATAHNQLLAERAANFDKLANLCWSELSQDVSWGASIEDSWKARVAELQAKESKLGHEIVDSWDVVNRLANDLDRLERRIAELREESEDERADLEIDLSEGASGRMTLRVDYVVPSACWRPWHTAQLLVEPSSQVEVTTDACVWQRTGEDWTDVELVFSTERASLGTDPPRLRSEVIAVKKKSEALVVETREQDIATAGLGGEPRGQTASELPGIDDGGEVLSLSSNGPVNVPSDGRPHRIRLGGFVSDSQVELCAFPEMEPAVLLKSTQSNGGKGPLLAGPVDLIRDSGLVGRTSILFVAAGENFELGWGPESDLRISREVDVLEEKSRMLSSWVERDTRIRLRLSNLGENRRHLTVTERVPVSEIEKVKVDVDRDQTTGSQGPDEQGFIRWNVDLDAYAHETTELVWKLKRHEDVVGV